jgi:hypothetical protein
MIIQESPRLPAIPTADDLFRFFRTIAFHERNDNNSRFNRLYENRVCAKKTNRTGPYTRTKPLYIEDTGSPDLPDEHTDQPFLQHLDTILQAPPTDTPDLIGKEIFHRYLMHGSIRTVCDLYGFEFNQVRKVVAWYKQTIETKYERTINA